MLCTYDALLFAYPCYAPAATIKHKPRTSPRRRATDPLIQSLLPCYPLPYPFIYILFISTLYVYILYIIYILIYL